MRCYPDVSPDSPGSQPPTPKLTRVASPPQALADLPTKGTGKLPQRERPAVSPKRPPALCARRVGNSRSAASLQLQLTSLLPPSESGKHPKKSGPCPFPATCRSRNGQLTSNNETIRSLIHYLSTSTADTFANRADLNGMQVKIRPNPYAIAGHKALKKHCKVKTAFVHADKPPRRKPAKDPQQAPLLQTPPQSQLRVGSIEGNVLMPLLTSVIESGPAALGPTTSSSSVARKWRCTRCWPPWHRAWK